MTPLDPTYGPVFRPGDRLAAADLTEWQRTPLFGLARHFRALHRSYGVASGVNVRFARDGELNWKLTVEPGTAFDAVGRALELGRPVEVVLTPAPDRWDVKSGSEPSPRPLEAEPYLVVLRGPDPERGPLNVEVPSLSYGARVELVPVAGLLSGDVPVAGLAQPRGKPTGEELTLGDRSNAVRGFRRPYLATGAVPAGTTTAPVENSPRTWRLWVDTRTAGFHPVAAEELHLAPVYLVTLGTQSESDARRLTAGTPAEVPAVVLSDVRPDGFLVTVQYEDDPKDNSLGPRATPLVVRWTGVELRRPAPVDPTPVRTEALIVSESTDRPLLPWPTFHDGRRLTPDDLNDVKQSVRELQWLHNRTLHDWGVADGYEVTGLEHRRGVRVRRGVAYDVQGRELLLNDLVELPLPPQAPRTGPDEVTEWWVTATYREASALPDADPSCRSDGVPLRRLPQAAVRWRDPRDSNEKTRLVPGMDVILATVTVARGEITAVSPVGRRSAVLSRRPYVAAGRTQGILEWGLWPYEEVETFEGIWIHIDTTSAGFVSTPQYLVQLEKFQPAALAKLPDEPRPFESHRRSLVQQFQGQEPPRSFVVDPTATHFRIVLLLGSATAAVRNRLAEMATDPAGQKPLWTERVLATIPWRFAWVGIEV
jgi:hypothetical protein